MKLAATIARFLQADMQAELRDLGRSGASGTRARTILSVRSKDAAIRVASCSSVESRAPIRRNKNLL